MTLQYDLAMVERALTCWLTSHPGPKSTAPCPTAWSLTTCATPSAPDARGGDTCLHRRCVRPDHLEPVTRLEQQRRRKDFQSVTCKNGHDRAEHSVLQQHAGDGKWYRHCVLCRKNNQHARYLRNRYGA